MNKKGFTLIELLAVILIISITLLLVFTSVIKIMQQNRNTKFQEYERLMEAAALLYFEKENSDDEVTLNKLIENNLIKDFGEGYTCTGKVTKAPKKVSLICTKDGTQIWPE